MEWFTIIDWFFRKPVNDDFQIKNIILYFQYTYLQSVTVKLQANLKPHFVDVPREWFSLCFKHKDNHLYIYSYWNYIFHAPSPQLLDFSTVCYFFDPISLMLLYTKYVHLTIWTNFIMVSLKFCQFNCYANYPTYVHHVTSIYILRQNNPLTMCNRIQKTCVLFPGWT